MPNPFSARTLPHIKVHGRVSAESFTRPGIPITPRRVHRQRQAHANRLLAELEQARVAVSPNLPTAPAALSTEGGLILEFESHQDFTLRLQTLDAWRSGLQLLNVRTREFRDAQGTIHLAELATVKVAPGALAKLVKKFTQFRDEVTGKGEWRHRDFVLPVEHIRRATLEALWNEEPDQPMPIRGVAALWEVWLQVGDEPEERGRVETQFRDAAEVAGIRVQDTRVELPETTVLLVKATQEQIAGSWEVLDCLQELRAPAVTAEFFQSMQRVDQRRWVEHLLTRLRAPQAGANAICLLDSGINESHPLLRPLVPADGLHTYSPAWGTADGCPGAGHGTLMAGLAGYGNLTGILAGNNPVEAGHHIESVRMLAPDETTRLNTKLWPEINRESVARIEGAAQRRRIFAQQITGDDASARSRGKPTAWSATLDQLAAGVNEPDIMHRLICISAGNTFPHQADEYPAANDTAQIHDPAQAWNILTVGGTTELVRLGGNHPAGTRPLAAAGALAPTTTTSLVWHDDWPLKPDVVAEAGNVSVMPDGSLDTPDDLSLLSTSAQVVGGYLATTGDTSAASVLVARLAANLQRAYPDFWPETLRALVVHSAEWTESMRDRRPLERFNKEEIWTMLRRVGFGVPDETRALRSASNALTMVMQDELQPYLEKEDGKVVTHQMHVHDLPWPQQQLSELGNQPVRLRVTLSYFVEPNPGRRLTNNRYRYASANLRFDLSRPLESRRDFRARINKQAREEEDSGRVPSDGENWVIGPSTRHRGSLHGDIWCGRAVDLALKGHLAVYPVGGWWKLRPKLGKANARMRYALTVSIEAPTAEVDLYATVAAQALVPTPVVVRT